MNRNFIYFFFFILLVSWEIFSKIKPELSIIFPPFSDIINCFLYSFDSLILQSFISLQSILASFFTAFIMAFLFSWIIISLKTVSSTLQNTLVVLQSIPLFATVPLIVIWFGWGKQSIIIPTSFMLFFPLTLNILHGFQSTPQELIDYFQINNASSQQIFRKLRLPHSIPHIFSGLKIAASTVGIGVLSGEWISGHNGLGILILESRRNYEIEMMFAAFIMLSIISILFYQLLLYIEKRFFQKYYSFHMKKHKFKFPFKIIFLLIATFLISKTWEKFDIFYLINTKFYSTKTSSSQKEKISYPYKITLCLDWIPNPNHIPLYVAAEKGFFKKNDINITIKPIYGDIGLQVTYLLNNKVDIILYNLYGIIKANLKGFPLQAISSLTKIPLGGLLCINNNIKRISDLNNKTFGFCLGNSKDISVLNHMFTNYNIKPKKIVNVSSDLIYPIITKKIDVLYGGFWNIEGAFFESLNLNTKAFLPHEYGQLDALDLVFCISQYSKYTTKDFITKFRNSIQESIIFCQKNIEESFNIYEKIFPTKTKKCLKWKKMSWEKTVRVLNANQDPISKTSINNIVNWLIKNHYNKLSVNENFDISAISPY